MNPPRPPASLQTAHFVAWTIAALLAMGLSACAAQPGKASAGAASTPVTHNCKPQETVGFSCELRDQRLLSLCASPGFEKFKGSPKNNPGYAYLVVGTLQGEVQYSYPPNPRDYKKHFYTGVPTNGIPYMFVTSSKGKFFILAEQDDTDPNGAGELEPENLPDGWDIGTGGATSPCLRLLNFENFSELGMTHETAWFRERDRLEAERAKAKQP